MHTHEAKESKLSGVPSYKEVSLIIRAHLHDLTNASYLPKAPFPNTTALR
jgi:hypothetical protein